MVSEPESPASKGRGFKPRQERREKFLLQGQLFVLVLISIFISLPVLSQQHVKDPGHSTQSAGGGLHVNIHAPHGYMVSNTVTPETGAWVYSVHRTCAEMASVLRGTSHATRKQLWNHFRGHSKLAM